MKERCDVSASENSVCGGSKIVCRQHSDEPAYVEEMKRSGEDAALQVNDNVICELFTGPSKGVPTVSSVDALNS